MVPGSPDTVAQLHTLPPHDRSPQFYDRRSAKLCAHCDRLLMWMYTRFGGKIPFDAVLLPKELDADSEGWLPGMWDVRGRKRMAMAPVIHYGRAKRDRVTHVAMIHKCEQYLAATQAKEATA